MTSDLLVRPYGDDDAPFWDTFCSQCRNATFLHTRRFLSYHGNRFRDRSCIVEGRHGWLGVLAAAEHPTALQCVVSHPGISYGGLLHRGGLVGNQQLAAFQSIVRHYHELGYATLRYKAIPQIYQVLPAQDDLYALFRLNATRYRCDLSSTIDLSERAPLAGRRRRSLRKAMSAGLSIRVGTEFLPSFWPVLTDNLARRHATQPVHSLAEICDLAARFPEAIRLVCAADGDEIVGGVLLFCTARVHHAQYVAASLSGQELGALDLVFDHCIAMATGAVRYFDFGISNEAEGRILNSGLYQFKTEFGGGGTAVEFYELKLGEALIPPQGHPI